jgi:hypothetical protein
MFSITSEHITPQLCPKLVQKFSEWLPEFASTLTGNRKKLSCPAKCTTRAPRKAVTCELGRIKCEFHRVATRKLLRRVRGMSNLRAIRRAAKLTQVQLAQRAEVSRFRICLADSGKLRAGNFFIALEQLRAHLQQQDCDAAQERAGAIMAWLCDLERLGTLLVESQQQRAGQSPQRT